LLFWQWVAKVAVFSQIGSFHSLNMLDTGLRTHR